MNYYLLTISTNQKEIGYFPQIEKINDLESIQAIRNHQKLKNTKEFPRIEKINDVYVNKKSKKTNFLSSLELSEGRGFFVDEKVKQIIEQINDNNSFFYPTNISIEENNYFFLYKNETPEVISFSESSFFKKEDFKEGIERVKIKSFEEWISLRK